MHFFDGISLIKNWLEKAKLDIIGKSQKYNIEEKYVRRK